MILKHIIMFQKKTNKKLQNPRRGGFPGNPLKPITMLVIFSFLSALAGWYILNNYTTVQSRHLAALLLGMAAISFVLSIVRAFRRSGKEEGQEHTAPDTRRTEPRTPRP